MCVRVCGGGGGGGKGGVNLRVIFFKKPLTTAKLEATITSHRRQQLFFAIKEEQALDEVISGMERYQSLLELRLNSVDKKGSLLRRRASIRILLSYVEP